MILLDLTGISYELQVNKQFNLVYIKQQKMDLLLFRYSARYSRLLGRKVVAYVVCAFLIQSKPNYKVHIFLSSSKLQKVILLNFWFFSNFFILINKIMH